MQRKVYIQICDSGWIIEKMARVLAEALPDVAYGLSAPKECKLHYHMPYLTCRGDTAFRSIGYFTHLESDVPRRDLFFRAARSFEYLICQSARTAQILLDAGHENLCIISPGVDIHQYTPEMRIGVVGRTYDSGRKGEALVRQLLDLPGIRWFFTGTGWPGPALNLPEQEMPNFYRSMDYILVPSTNEGGPMCVLEALACGKEVIAPDVGWVNEFPHIPYGTGDVESLRTVLLKLWDQRMKLREAVVARTWENWVCEHDRLFERLGQRKDHP